MGARCNAETSHLIPCSLFGPESPFLAPSLQGRKISVPAVCQKRRSRDRTHAQLSEHGEDPSFDGRGRGDMILARWGVTVPAHNQENAAMTRPTEPHDRGLPHPAERPKPPLDMRAACRELLGEQWARPLAYLLGIDPRSLQRMGSGQNTIPPRILNHLRELRSVCRSVRADMRSGDSIHASVDLRAAGEELFGTWWQTPLGNLADVSARRIERMASDEDPVPASIARVLVPALLAIARRSRDDAARDRKRRAAERTTDNPDAMGRDIADRYSVTLSRHGNR